MNNSDIEAIRHRIAEYNRYDLCAHSWDGLIITRIGRVQAVRVRSWLGELVHQDLVAHALHTPIIGDDHTGYWMILVHQDLDIDTHARIRSRLWDAPGVPIALAAPGNILVYPTPGRTHRRWIQNPRDTTRLPLSRILRIAEEHRDRTAPQADCTPQEGELA